MQGDLALALDDYKVGDTVMLKVQRGAGDPQVCPSPCHGFLLYITVHDGDFTIVPGQGRASLLCELFVLKIHRIITNCSWLLEQVYFVCQIEKV